MIRHHLTLIISGGLVALFALLTLITPLLVNRPPTTPSLFPLIERSPDRSDDTFLRALEEPSSEHWMGTDYVGRDVFSRLLHALRNSILFSVVVVIAAVCLGVSLGAVMGFYGGRFDFIVSRIVELITTFPTFLLQLTMLAFFPQNYGILFFVMMIKAWIPYARFSRAEFLKLRHQEFVMAAEAAGSTESRLIFKHLLPNSLTPILCTIPFDLSGTIVGLGALSFLGFGEPLHVASVGELLKQAQDHFQQAWWLAIYPGVALFLLTLSLALFGSGVRDILDPKDA